MAKTTPQAPATGDATDAQKDLALPQGAFVPPLDASALCSALYRVLSEEHSPARAQMLAHAAERVRQTYALSRWAERVCAAYAEITEIIA